MLISTHNIKSAMFCYCFLQCFNFCFARSKPCFELYIFSQNWTADGITRTAFLRWIFFLCIGTEKRLCGWGSSVYFVLFFFIHFSSRTCRRVIKFFPSILIDLDWNKFGVLLFWKRMQGKLQSDCLRFILVERISH